MEKESKKTKEDAIPKFITELVGILDVRDEDEKEESNFEIEEALESLRSLGCIKNSEKEKGVVEQVAKLIQDYKKSCKKEQEGDISKLEEVDQLIQDTIYKALEEKKLQWETEKHPAKFARRFDFLNGDLEKQKWIRKFFKEKQAVRKRLEAFEENFCVGDSTVWENPRGGRKHPLGFMKNQIQNIDQILKIWKEFYSAEMKKHTSERVIGEWNQSIGNFKIRIQKVSKTESKKAPSN